MSENKSDESTMADFGSMLAEFEKENPGGATGKKRRSFKAGETVRGRVVSIGGETAFIEVGGKSEGMLELAELRDEKGELSIHVGDEIEAIVVESASSKYDGSVLLRQKLGRGAGKGRDSSAELEQAFELGIPVEGLVSGVNKGGVEVQVAGVRAFCPISQLELRHVEDGAAYIGRRLSFRITKCQQSERGRGLDVVLSRRSILEDEAAVKGAEARTRIALGAILTGTVTSINDYGAFVDLGGVEGMLHVSELGHSRVTHPKDVLSVGQNIEVQVVRIEKNEDGEARPGDKPATRIDPKSGKPRPTRGEKIALSLKSLEADPWAEAVSRFPVGARLTGKVTRVEVYGAFVELAPGIEGLVHVSQLGADKRLKHAKEAVRPGESVEVKVLAVETDKRRISLQIGSAARAAEDEEEARASLPAMNAKASLGTFGDLLKGATKKK